MTHRLVVTFVGALAIVVGVGCAGVKEKPGGTGTGGTGAGVDGGGVDNRTIDGISISDTIGLTCGNGVIDGTEQCDDGNTMSGDGCSKLCQIEADFTCLTVGQLCVNTSICGDGTVSSQELCDDGNTVSGDGCSSDCKTIETGYVCRVPGRKCTPKCGDGMIIGGEKCDDGNPTPGDGCSANCLVEPGATCTNPPGMKSVCTVSVCGDGKQQGNESCDCGTSLTGPFPTGCTGPNGLFNGDGTGCSKTCTKEPVCRSAAGVTQACATSCGNGNKEPGEDCDDGNKDPGDGCDSNCKVEAGFTCTPMPHPDTVTCTQTGNSGQCLELPIKYRDFKNESVTGGHPDFFFLGTSPIANPVTESGVQGQAASMTFNKRYCVSNSSGPAKKNDSVNRCWDVAKANLDATGKPAFNTARTGGTNCDCQFIDWDHNGNSGHVGGYGDAGSAGHPLNGLTYVQGETMNGSPMYRGPAPIVASPASFGQWWTDNTYTGNTHVVGNLELAPTAGGQYQFSSQVNSVLGGFFPLDPPGQYPLYGAVTTAGPGAVHTVGTEAMLCNLWPYWFTSATFGAGAGCKSDQYLFPPSLMTGMTAPYTPANWDATINAMYPNGTWYPQVQGWYHDSWFSDEARYLFNYNAAFTLQFYGDDDMYIFINGILVVDLGGVHQRLPGLVQVAGPTDANPGRATITEGGSLDATGTNILPCSTASVDPFTKVPFNTLSDTDGNGHSNCTISTCDCRSRTVDLGLANGSTYEIAVFGADRHPTESNYQLTLSGFSTNQSNCGPACGDGVATGGEECDCGNAGVTAMDIVGCAGMNNNDTLYGGCTTACKYGPYCGDNVVNGPEECDNGPANGITYTPTPMSGACTLGCKFAHFCGDGIVDGSEGELCDQGPLNGTAGAACKIDCSINIDI